MLLLGACAHARPAGAPAGGPRPKITPSTEDRRPHDAQSGAEPWRPSRLLGFGSVPVRRVDPTVDLGAPVRMLLRGSRDPALRDRLAKFHTEVGIEPRGVWVRVGRAAVPVSEVQPRHLDATFFVDFDQPPVAELLEHLQAGGKRPTPVGLRDFVASHFKQARSGGFDPASLAARTASGDCSEHAVLLAALARGLKMPARVILGVAIVEHRGELYGFGHAWTQIHANGSWQSLDATLIEAAGYLATSELLDESPTTGLSLAREIAAGFLFPESIEISHAR